MDRGDVRLEVAVLSEVRRTLATLERPGSLVNTLNVLLEVPL